MPLSLLGAPGEVSVGWVVYPPSKMAGKKGDQEPEWQFQTCRNKWGTL